MKRHKFSTLRKVCYSLEIMFVQSEACLKWPYIEIFGN